MKRLSISKAIEQARKDVTLYTAWNDRFQMWEQINCPAGYDRVHFRKIGRIVRALELLGVSDDEIGGYLSTMGPGSMEELVRAYFE